MNDNICPNCGVDIEYEYGLTDMTKCPNCGADLKEERDVKTSTAL